MKRNYQKELDHIIANCQEKGQVPKLLLHSCCAPCSSYVLEYLSNYFSITVFYYNPNIFPESEYSLRVEEQQRFIDECQFKYPVSFIAGDYQPDRFYEAVKGLEQLGERSERCNACFRLRLDEAAKLAEQYACDYFTTTLSISPLKDAAALNDIGEAISSIYNVAYLPSDFKKRNGYKRSVELSMEHQMYRQDYCGCVFSKQERLQDKVNRKED